MLFGSRILKCRVQLVFTVFVSISEGKSEIRHDSREKFYDFASREMGRGGTLDFRLHV